jgi:hypothetical protein
MMCLIGKKLTGGMREQGRRRHIDGEEPEAAGR